jgi:hypothetical protein
MLTWVKWKRVYMNSYVASSILRFPLPHQLPYEKTIIRLAPLGFHGPFRSGLQTFNEQTFADCHEMPGFTGGGWAYFLERNDVIRVKADGLEVGHQVVKQGDEMLAYCG